MKRHDTVLFFAVAVLVVSGCQTLPFPAYGARAGHDNPNRL